MAALSTPILSPEMTAVVVPFQGPEGKTRLHAPRRTRRALGLAMLGDVLSACVAVGATTLVTADEEARAVAGELGAGTADDPDEGQGGAVAAGLRGLEPGGILIVNADVPCVVPRDLRALLAATPAGGIALVEALDGTTNALSLPSPEVFAPLYGRDSASRFRRHADGLGLLAVSAAIPNLIDDVDTIDDLRRLQLRAGPRTQVVLAELPAVEALS
jgi:2-phospho-L-lactate/phosphoenolpyruvate guanylyltransferase